MITALGEVLWDVYPDGAKFGGAPANFASHCAALYNSVAIVSAVGGDDLGQQAIQELQAKGVQTEWIAEKELPTGQVQVTLDENGKPSYEIVEGVAWDALSWSAELERLASTTKLVYFGTLGQRSDQSQQVIEKFLAHVSADCLKVLDINLRAPFYHRDLLQRSIQQCNVLKCSDEELAEVAMALSLDQPDIHNSEQLEAFAQQLRLQTSVHTFALTKGAEGAVLFSEEGTITQSGFPARVLDTVGAGDSFTAALAVGLLKQLPLSEVLDAACRISAFVCEQSGATPQIPAKYTKLYRRDAALSSIAQASMQVVGWRETVSLPDWGIKKLRAKIDTGAQTSAVHVENLVHIDDQWIEFVVVIKEKPKRRVRRVRTKPIRTTTVKSSNGISQERIVCETTLRMGGQEHLVEVTLVARKGMECRMLVGRTSLSGRYLVDVSHAHLVDVDG